RQPVLQFCSPGAFRLLLAVLARSREFRASANSDIAAPVEQVASILNQLKETPSYEEKARVDLGIHRCPIVGFNAVMELLDAGRRTRRSGDQGPPSRRQSSDTEFRHPKQ